MLVYGLRIDFENYVPELEGHSTDYVYLHGKVEKMNGFDLVWVTEMPTEDGIYDCEVRTCNSEELIPCKFFYWTTETPFKRDRGLIVMLGDNEHMQDAQAKFDERTPYL